MICLLVLMGAALAGCGGGSPQARQRHTNFPPRPDATAASVGPIELVFLRIEQPANRTHAAGADVGLYMTIVNRHSVVDRLTDVTSPDAARVVMRNGVNAPARRVNMRIPKDGTVSLQHPDKAHLELSGLKRQIRPGVVVPVRFTFERAGSVTVGVHVQLTNHPIVPRPTSSRSAPA